MNLPPGAANVRRHGEAREAEPERHLATALVVVDGDGRLGGVDAGDGVGRDETGARMNFRFTVVETSLNRAEFRWKWLRFLQHSFLLGVILCALVLLFGGAIILGWVTSKALATTFFALLGVVGFIAWAVIIISVSGRRAGAELAGGGAGAGEPAAAGPVEHAALPRTPPRGRARALVCPAHRPANARCAGGERPRRQPFPATRRAEVHAGLHRGAGGRPCWCISFTRPGAGCWQRRKPKRRQPAQAEKPLELSSAGHQQRRAKPGLGRSPHH